MNIKYRVIIAFIVLFFIVLSGIVIYESILLSRDPILTEFTERDIKTMEKGFSINFPQNTEFIEAQYHWSFQEPAVSVIFKIPVESFDAFLNQINVNYEKSETRIDLGSDTDNAEAYYESKNRQFTGIYIYPEKNGFKKCCLIFNRPGDDVSRIFSKIKF
ncbi:MAG TPA: hypothetical protein PLR73_13440 [Acetivibrio sp.]|jgi:hypothetical protein|nr:hypothetical protein [Acetivibrio sp.]